MLVGCFVFGVVGRSLYWSVAVGDCCGSVAVGWLLYVGCCGLVAVSVSRFVCGVVDRSLLVAVGRSLLVALGRWGRSLRVSR